MQENKNSKRGVVNVMGKRREENIKAPARRGQSNSHTANTNTCTPFFYYAGTVLNNGHRDWLSGIIPQISIKHGHLFTP